MKKILVFSLMLVSALSFWSCKDDDDPAVGDADRLFRPMFRCENNIGPSTDPYYCTILDRNSAHLYWYTVDDAVGYEIKWAMQNYVANGEDAWLEAENGLNGKQLAGDTVITDPKVYDLLIEHLNYQTDYRFAIRALHSYSPTDDSWRNDPKNSLWYGYGNGREWAEYLGLQTSPRYEVPFVIQVSDITKTSMHLTLNRSLKSYVEAAAKTDAAAEAARAQLETFREKFHFVDANQEILKVDYLTFTASSSTPNATVNPTYVRYQIPENAWDENGICEITVDGLSENSCYVIDVWDNSIKVPVDACFNSTMKRTRGTPNAPILINHVPNSTDTIGTGANANVYDISQYNSMKLDNILDGYCASNETPENQEFYLEGGKTYHVTSNVQVYKGFTLRTNPADVAQGKRAKLLLSGMTQTGNAVNTCNFMLGRQPVAGENASITLDIDSIRFMDLDVDVPRATNYGHAQEGIGNAVGNYFMNMYSNGMGINVTTLEWRNCSFQGLIRGFFRIQGSNDFYIQHIRLIDCDFYNCGYYSNNGGDYAYIFGDHNGKPKSNILQDVEVAGCVFYDNPKRSVVTDNGRNLTWDSSVRWNIRVHHNTFVNFCTVANNEIMTTRYMPGGSNFEFYDNVIILTRDEKDVNRTMMGGGWYSQNVQGGDGSGMVTFKIYNNWTTNDPYLNNGQPFFNRAFNGTSNAPAKWLKTWGNEGFPYGGDELVVHLDETLKATDLMVSPNPQHFKGLTANHLDHHTDTGIDGLYYKQTVQVLNSPIYLSGAGCQRLVKGK